MRNLKHTIIAIAAFVMVGTLSCVQITSNSAKKQERDMKLTTANKAENITIASAEGELGTIAVALTNDENEVAAAEAAQTPELPEDVSEQEIAEKSYLTLGYANVTGSVEIKEDPNEEAKTTGKMSGADQVEILESTDGWYKISDNGQIGYVESEQVTLDKSEAKESALQYDHYKKANVTAENGLVVRSSGSSDANVEGTVNDGDNLIVVDSDGDYIKVLYGADYKEGYVINTGLETTGEWVEKSDVHSEIKRVAAEKAEAARQEEIARQNAARAASSYSTTNGTSASTAAQAAQAATESAGSVVTSGSGKGQAIVNTAMKYLGTPYRWGGTSPGGFDCSGLVQYVCRANGISVPRVAASQRGAGRYVSRENLQPGDLVFFSNGGGISHVGIYAGNGNMVHAPHTGDVVKVASINSSYRISHYAGAVRVW
ncbi:MAG: C40 family peptidase [Clostridia bacterium]|nr:C40 family peptidase [Clostridia bacterium]